MNVIYARIYIDIHMVASIHSVAVYNLVLNINVSILQYMLMFDVNTRSCAR